MERRHPTAFGYNSEIVKEIDRAHIAMAVLANEGHSFNLDSLKTAASNFLIKFLSEESK